MGKMYWGSRAVLTLLVAAALLKTWVTQALGGAAPDLAVCAIGFLMFLYPHEFSEYGGKALWRSNQWVFPSPSLGQMLGFIMVTVSTGRILLGYS